MFPTFFVSHGAPTLALQRTAATTFFRSLSTLVERPKAILVVSAHWETDVPTVGTGTETIHDFHGFPEPLYQLRYEPTPAKDVAAHAVAVLKGIGETVAEDAIRGRDHGMWVPLLLAWPEADIPVAQVSLVHGAPASRHFRIGQALKPLRDEGVLIIGSGSATHNLRHLSPNGQTAPWATAFISWLDTTLERNDDAGLQAWQTSAPHARMNHPTPEHFDPIFVARGAAAGEKTTLVHSSWEFGSLSMNAYRFGA